MQVNDLLDKLGEAGWPNPGTSQDVLQCASYVMSYCIAPLLKAVGWCADGRIQDQIISELYNRLSQLEAKWLTRIILKVCIGPARDNDGMYRV